MTWRRALVRSVAGLAALASVATGVIGVAHTSWGRPLLRLPLLSSMAKRAGCPVGAIEPVAFEAVRAERLRGDVGLDQAKAHPALGFVLGQTRRPDVDAWVGRERLACKAGFVASVLECDDVASFGAPKIARLRLQFDDEARLVSVDLFRNGSAAELVPRYEQLGRELDAVVGPATASAGTSPARFTTSAPFDTAMRTHAYRDYVAKATLLSLGKRGARLRETYQWLAARPPA
jgi:hypothetical protein